MTFRVWLRTIRACPEARKWVGARSAAQAWAECSRGDWMLWLLERMADKPGWPSRQTVYAASNAASVAFYAYAAYAAYTAAAARRDMLRECARLVRARVPTIPDPTKRRRSRHV